MAHPNMDDQVLGNKAIFAEEHCGSANVLGHLWRKPCQSYTCGAAARLSRISGIKQVLGLAAWMMACEIAAAFFSS